MPTRRKKSSNKGQGWESYSMQVGLKILVFALAVRLAAIGAAQDKDIPKAEAKPSAKSEVPKPDAKSAEKPASGPAERFVKARQRWNVLDQQLNDMSAQYQL